MLQGIDLKAKIERQSLAVTVIFNGSALLCRESAVVSKADFCLQVTPNGYDIFGNLLPRFVLMQHSQPCAELPTADFRGLPNSSLREPANTILQARASLLAAFQVEGVSNSSSGRAAAHLSPKNSEQNCRIAA